MEPLIFIGAIGMAGWYFWGRRYIQANRVANALKSIQGFSPGFTLIDADATAVALDIRSKRIAFVNRASIAIIYGFRDIIAVEACRNGISITKTNRGSQVLAAAIGQLLFGEKGFLIGGNTGSRTTSERVSMLSLKVFLADAKHPVTEIKFYRGSPIDLQSRRCRNCVTEMDEWYGRLRVAILNP